MNIRVSHRQIRDVNCENFERSRGISSFGRTTRPFDHPPPLTCACLCPWVSRFFHPNVHQARHDRSLSPPASKQPHAHACALSNVRTGFRLCVPVANTGPRQCRRDEGFIFPDARWPERQRTNRKRERSRDKARVEKKRVREGKKAGRESRCRPWKLRNMETE